MDQKRPWERPNYNKKERLLSHKESMELLRKHILEMEKKAREREQGKRDD